MQHTLCGHMVSPAIRLSILSAISCTNIISQRIKLSVRLVSKFCSGHRLFVNQTSWPRILQICSLFPLLSIFQISVALLPLHPESFHRLSTVLFAFRSHLSCIRHVEVRSQMTLVSVIVTPSIVYSIVTFQTTHFLFPHYVL